MSGFIPGGTNYDFIDAMKQVENIVLLGASQTFASPTTFANADAWHVIMSTNQAGWMPKRLTGYEPTSPEPTVETSGKGGQYQTMESPPSAKFFIDANYIDFNSLLQEMRGETFTIVFIMNDGGLYGYQASAGATVKGFSCRVNAKTIGIPVQGSLTQAYELDVYFIDQNEFKQSTIEVPAWNPMVVLPSYAWTGYDMQITTEYVIATKTVVVKISERNRAKTGKTGFLAADFEVISSNQASCEIDSIVDNGSGSYDILIDDTSTALASGEWAWIRMKKAATFEVSNRLLVAAPVS